MIWIQNSPTVCDVIGCLRICIAWLIILHIELLEPWRVHRLLISKEVRIGFIAARQFSGFSGLRLQLFISTMLWRKPVNFPLELTAARQHSGLTCRSSKNLAPFILYTLTPPWRFNRRAYFAKYMQEAVLVTRIFTETPLSDSSKYRLVCWYKAFGRGVGAVHTDV